jgi:hypothetical protein
VAASPSSDSHIELDQRLSLSAKIVLRYAPPLLSHIVGSKILEVCNYRSHEKQGIFKLCRIIECPEQRGDINTRVNLRDMVPTRVYSNVLDLANRQAHQAASVAFWLVLVVYCTAVFTLIWHRVHAS